MLRIECDDIFNNPSAELFADNLKSVTAAHPSLNSTSMERFPRTPEDADKLLKLSDLLRDAALTVKEEWAKEVFTESSANPNGKANGNHGHHGHKATARILPSRKLWDAERTIEAISGVLVELVSEPHQRIQQVLTQYMESRALFIAAERRIPDLLAEAGDEGLDIKTLGEKTNIEYRKLGTWLSQAFYSFNISSALELLS